MARRTSSIERRRFLELGAAVSLSAVLPELSSAGGRAAVSDQGIVRPHAAIYDERFEAARRFARSVSSVGVPVHPIRGDVTQLWYSHLYPLWKRAPAPIAGLTAYGAMFCLERLAWDQRLRMIRFAEGSLHRWLIAEPAQLAAFTARSIGA